MTVAETARPTATQSEELIESTNAVRATDAISVPFAPSRPLTWSALPTLSVRRCRTGPLMPREAR